MHINSFRDRVYDALFKKRNDIDQTTRMRIIRNCFLLGDEDKLELKSECFVKTEMYLQLALQHDLISDKEQKKYKLSNVNAKSLLNLTGLERSAYQQKFIDIKNNVPEDGFILYTILSTLSSLFKLECKVINTIETITQNIQSQLNEMNMWFAIESGIQHSDSMDSLVTAILKIEFFGSLKRRLSLLKRILPFEHSFYFQHTASLLNLILQYILDYKILERVVSKTNKILEELRSKEYFFNKFIPEDGGDIKNLLAQLGKESLESNYYCSGIIDEIVIEVLATKKNLLVDNSRITDSFELIKSVIYNELEIVKRVFILDRHFKIKDHEEQ